MKENKEENNDNEVEVKKVEIPKIKIVVIGDHSTGKTSFIDKICTNEFNKQVETTINTKINYYNYNNDKDNYIFEFNDLGGQDYNIVINKIILKNINAIIYCCSRDQEESLENILKWNEVCLNTIASVENLPKFIVINKCDLEEKFEERKIKEVKNEIAKKYYYVSAKDNIFKKEDSKQIELNEFVEDLLKNIDNLENVKEVLNESGVDLGLDLNRKNSDANSQISQQKGEGDSNKCNC
jgi:small GTP-binding protein